MINVLKILGILEANFVIKTQEKESLTLAFTRFLNFYNRKARFVIKSVSEEEDGEDTPIGRVLIEQVSKDEEPFVCKCLLTNNQGKSTACVFASSDKDNIEEESIKIHQLFDTLAESTYEKARGTRGRHKGQSV